MIGIYKITNKINGKSYIGQSIHIEKRWKEHKSMQHYDDYKTTLYSAFRKYGIENFTFKVLVQCGKEDLDDLEKYYIKKYDTFKNGYNMNRGGQKCNPTHSKEQHRKIGLKHKGKRNSKETRNKISQSLKLYYSKYGVSEEKRRKISETSKNRKMSLEAKEKISNKVSKKIYQYDLQGNLINSYKNAREANKMTNINYANISSCCNGKRNKAGNYYWSFERKG